MTLSAIRGLQKPIEKTFHDIIRYWSGGGGQTQLEQLSKLLEDSSINENST